MSIVFWRVGGRWWGLMLGSICWWFEMPPPKSNAEVHDRLVLIVFSQCF